MKKFQLTNAIRPTVLRTTDQALIPDDPQNIDWIEYQAWLKEGNTPDPAPEDDVLTRGEKP